jgi:hypothetical protein
VRRYVRRLELPQRLQAACVARVARVALGGDYGGARLASLLLALPYGGARRLERLKYLVGDSLVRRFAGLARAPRARTVRNWLRRFMHPRRWRHIWQNATIRPAELQLAIRLSAVYVRESRDASVGFIRGTLFWRQGERKLGRGVMVVISAR